jgi:hypothetical protein
MWLAQFLCELQFFKTPSGHTVLSLHHGRNSELATETQNNKDTAQGTLPRQNVDPGSSMGHKTNSGYEFADMSSVLTT